MRAIRPDKVRRILVRGTNWVGDAVMCIPALRELRRLFPESNISLLVRPWVKDVYAAVDFVDDVLEYDDRSMHRGWAGKRRLCSELGEHKFDLAVLLQNAFEAAFLAWWARIPLRLGYARDGRSLFLTHRCRIDPEVRRVHQAYYYLGILSGVGLLPDRLWQNPDYRLRIQVGLRDSDSAWARKTLASYGVGPEKTVIGINPGAYYGGAKRWLSDRYAQVADHLAAQREATILIFGASNELRIAEELAHRMRHSPVILAGQTTLGQLMALIKCCDLLITNDSGPMHLAAALDVRQLAIFGSTSEVATGPLSASAQVIKHPVECNPCFLRECPIDLRCMKGVTVERVLAAAERMLDTAVKG